MFAPAHCQFVFLLSSSSHSSQVKCQMPTIRERSSFEPQTTSQFRPEQCMRNLCSLSAPWFDLMHGEIEALQNAWDQLYGENQDEWMSQRRTLCCVASKRSNLILRLCNGKNAADRREKPCLSRRGQGCVWPYSSFLPWTPWKVARSSIEILCEGGYVFEPFKMPGYISQAELH
ncbi:uncharacterized protein CIMG_07948 [Coccidioides immitis RS]|uniref:Uncharacterized protein n=1 Tax=Coccidioides immitis (strain RS) TaxID=246410 RepID=J3K4G9_COCIM|nr:uncharacterized protein CIMG_07948 [Coccidioides immitis RS]EAS29202.3 hypothetical protein CIMG_07948 [Coccidioides immitis RS]